MPPLAGGTQHGAMDTPPGAAPGRPRADDRPPLLPRSPAPPPHREVDPPTVLRPFSAGAAETVAGWGRGADEVRLWCGLDAVSAATVAAWSTPPDVTAFLLLLGGDGGEPVAYGELWVDDEEREVELAHLIVAPDRRGRGLGRRLVAALAVEARRHHPDVVVRVHPDNAAAQACYRGAGFVRVAAAAEAEWNRDQPVDYVWMALRDG